MSRILKGPGPPSLTPPPKRMCAIRATEKGKSMSHLSISHCVCVEMNNGCAESENATNYCGPKNVQCQRMLNSNMPCTKG